MEQNRLLALPPDLLKAIIYYVQTKALCRVFNGYNSKTYIFHCQNETRYRIELNLPEKVNDHGAIRLITDIQTFLDSKTDSTVNIRLHHWETSIGNNIDYFEIWTVGKAILIKFPRNHSRPVMHLDKDIYWEAVRFMLEDFKNWLANCKE